MKKIKISELPSSTEMEGLYTIGTDANNQSVKVPMGFLKETTEYVTEKTAEAVATANQAKSAIDNLKASDVPYDLTQTPDLGDGDVQSAIEALDGMVEQLSLDTMGKKTDGSVEEYWEDLLFEKHGYSAISANDRRIGANHSATTDTSGVHRKVYIFPASEGDVFKWASAAGSGDWTGFWKGGTAYANILAANYLSSTTLGSGTATAPAGATCFAYVTTDARINNNTAHVWKKTTREAKTPADIQRQLIELEAGCVNTSALEVGEVMPYWAAASTIHGIRLEVRKGQVLLLDLVGTANYAPLVFTDKDRVITEIHQTPVYGAFEVPNDGYAYIQKLISHESDNYLYIMGYGGHAKDIGNLQAQFDAMYQKGVEDGSGMASIVGLGYNIFDYITGAVNMEGFEYGCNLRRTFDKTPPSGSWQNKYKSNTSLCYFPTIDTSAVTNFSQTFYGCTNLRTIGSIDATGSGNTYQTFLNCANLVEIHFEVQSTADLLDTFSGCSNLRKVTGLSELNKLSNGSFRNCTKLESVDLSDGVSFRGPYQTFQNCKALKYLPRLGASTASFNGTFYNCSALVRIEEIDFIGATDYGNASYNLWYSNGGTGCTSLRYVLIKNFGYNSGCTAYYGNRTPLWGIANDEVPDARQSLIDSLITYSFDRATAGYSACTITLSSATKALLTEEEIEQITAKGYTIA